ncbi:MAG: PHP domain-containing protein, partial [Thermoanaerobaculia bacterium]
MSKLRTLAALVVLSAAFLAVPAARAANLKIGAPAPDFTLPAASDGKAVALTDHANMFGAITFYKAAKEQGVQAILGAELDVVAAAQEGSHHGGSHTHHLPLLACSAEGYKNLVALVTRGQIDPDKSAPAGSFGVSLESIAAKAKGLVATTGCMGGLVSQAILEEG